MTGHCWKTASGWHCPPGNMTFKKKSVNRVILLYLNCLLGHLSLIELYTGCRKCCWTVTGSSRTICRYDFTLVELSTDWLDSGWTSWFDCSWAIFLVTPSIRVFNEYTIRVTVLLEYLDRTFSACGCNLFYNLLIFNPILLSCSRGSFLCLVHIHSNFYSLLIAVCVILRKFLIF